MGGSSIRGSDLCLHPDVRSFHFVEFCRKYPCAPNYIYYFGGSGGLYCYLVNQKCAREQCLSLGQVGADNHRINSGRFAVKEMHPSELFDKMVDFLAAKAAVYILLIVAVGMGASAAVTHDKNQKSLLAGGACGVALLGQAAKNWERSKKEMLGEIREASRQGFKSVLSGLFSPTSKLTINFDVANWSPENLIQLADIIKMLKVKHLRLIGGTGDGKSVLAKCIARLIDGEVVVYDVEATKKDWQGFKVVGRGENWQAVADAMKADLKLLSDRVREATDDDNGWDSLTGRETIRIAEEYPDVRTEINKIADASTDQYDGLADEWNTRIARRGRKTKIMNILISQYDTVEAWGFQGRAQLAKCFRTVCLGEFAIEQARKLKDKRLEAWLKQDLTSRCMVDNLPCQLPSREAMIMVGINGLQPTTATVLTKVNSEKDASQTTVEVQVINSSKPQLAWDKLTEPQQQIVLFAKGRANQKIPAWKLQNDCSYFKSRNYEVKFTVDDIRLFFQSLADAGWGRVEGVGDRMGYVWEE